MNILRTIVAKELLDGVRDRRSLFSAFLFPFLAPLFIYGLMTLVIQQNTETESITLPVINADAAPALVAHLKEAGFIIEAFEGDPEAEVAAKTVELVLSIPIDYQKTMAAFETTRVTIIHDGSRNDTSATVRQVRNLVRIYSSELNALRLVSRGVSPKLIRGLQTENGDIASDEQRAANFLSFVPIYVLMAAFVCGLGLAIDQTAGERERRSLEPLLINPVSRLSIVFGKCLAASIVAALGMLITLAMCLGAMLMLPIDELGIRFSLKAQQVVGLIMAILPIPLLASSLQLLLGLFAKSFKDAQSYVGFLVFIPVVPTLVMNFLPFATSFWMYFVPVFGQSIMMKEILGAEPVPLLAYPAAALPTLLAGLLVCWLTSRLLDQERVIQS
ncbi:MAG: ABC transporter permease [Proteobacteria bacterium]|nr:ABC transporter permease [Pseudomonadota bacterium]